MVLNLHYRTAVYLVPMSALIGQKPTVLYTGRPIEFYFFVVLSFLKAIDISIIDLHRFTSVPEASDVQTCECSPNIWSGLLRC